MPVKRRLATGQTGARWQLAHLGQPESRTRPDLTQLSVMLEAYRLRSETNEPVAEWPQ